MQEIFSRNKKWILGFLILSTFIIVALGLRGIIYVPNSIKIGPISLKLYGLFIGLGIFVVISILEHFQGSEKARIYWDGLFFVLIPAIIGARLWHVITDFHLYQNNILGIFEIWNGGLGILGAVFGGILGSIIYFKHRNVPILETFEWFAIFFPIGHAVGRLGNFVNQELFGPPTELPWGMYIRPENRPSVFSDFDYFHPIFLYEALGNIILFIILFKLFRKFGIKGDGFFVALYFLGYGILRFCINFIRMDSGSSFIYNQILVIILAAFSCIYLIKLKIKSK